MKILSARHMDIHMKLERPLKFSCKKCGLKL